MADPERDSSGDNPLRRIQEHVLPLLTAVGGLVTVLVGVGYEAFYSRLGVRPAEIALGARDVVIRRPGPRPPPGRERAADHGRRVLRDRGAFDVGIPANLASPGSGAERVPVWQRLFGIAVLVAV